VIGICVCGQGLFISLGACPTCVPGSETAEPSHEEYLLQRYPELAPEIERLKAVPVPPTVEEASDTPESVSARQQLLFTEGKT
jgi:hypothetical protein